LVTIRFYLFQRGIRGEVNGSFLDGPNCILPGDGPGSSGNEQNAE